MRNKLFLFAVCLILHSFVSTYNSHAQLVKPYNEVGQGLNGLNLNPYLNSQSENSRFAEYASEFYGASLGLAAGGATAFGFLSLGLISYGFNLEPLAYVFFAAGGIAALAAPAYAGYLLHGRAQRYHDKGSLGLAMLGMYIGSALALGVVVLAVNATNNGSSILPGLLIPGTVGVLFFNSLMQPQNKVSNTSLVNFKSGKFNPGFPLLSVGQSQSPFANRTLTGQISILSISF